MSRLSEFKNDISQERNSVELEIMKAEARIKKLQESEKMLLRM